MSKTSEAGVHRPWCEERHRDHDGEPCSLYGGSLATNRALLTTTAEADPDDDSSGVAVVLSYAPPLRPDVRIELTPTDAATVGRQLVRLGQEFDGSKTHRRRGRTVTPHG